MENTDRNAKKLPIQEIDYFNIGKILLSRWYWIASTLLISMAWSYIYLWYTPKTYATSGTMKLEEKKSELPDMNTVVNPSDRGPSRIQSETSIIQSQSVIINAVKDLNYPISFYIEGRVRTSEIYPVKPFEVQPLQFDSVNFYRDLITFKALNTKQFRLTV